MMCCNFAYYWKLCYCEFVFVLTVCFVVQKKDIFSPVAKSFLLPSHQTPCEQIQDRDVATLHAPVILSITGKFLTELSLVYNILLRIIAQFYVGILFC